MSTPMPVVKRREVDMRTYEKACNEGFSKIASRVIAGRVLSSKATTIRQAVMPKLTDIESPDTLQDIGAAVDQLINALDLGLRTCILSDFDSDGCSSSAVLYRGFIRLGFKEENLLLLSAHRLIEGYGISDKLVRRILELSPRPALIVTADNGSSNAESIAYLKREGITTIVTDHHALLEGPPAAAAAVVNPIRQDCQFPDKSLAGVGVAFMLLIALRKRLIEMERIKPNLSLIPLLSFCGLGTQADSVDLGRSLTNRAMVRYSLERIQKDDTYPCWAALKKLGKGRDQIIDSEFLQFFAVPAINAAGRMDVSKHASDFFITNDHDEANRLAEKLYELNEHRKNIEREMFTEAKAIAQEQHNQGRLGLVCYLPQGNPGVVGIVAAKIMQMFGKPTLIAAPMLGEAQQYTASMRTTEHYSIKDGIGWIKVHFPDVILRGGGHKAAGGVGGEIERFQELEYAFNESVGAQVTDSKVLQPVIETDGIIEPSDISLSLIEELRSLQPYGQGFPSPLFEAEGYVEAVRMVGTPAVHAQVKVVIEQRAFKAIWFFAVEEVGLLPIVEAGIKFHWVFSINENIFRGESNIQLIIRHCTHIEA